MSVVFSCIFNHTLHNHHKYFIFMFFWNVGMLFLTGESITCVSLPQPCHYQTPHPSLAPQPMIWSITRVLPSTTCPAQPLCPLPVDGQGMDLPENFQDQVGTLKYWYRIPPTPLFPPHQLILHMCLLIHVFTI